MKKSITVLASCLIAANTYAHNIKFDKPITTTVTVTSTKNASLIGSKKAVTLMSLRLTEKQKLAISKYKSSNNSVRKMSTSTLPPAVNLGMNKVPVLDQGYHGTCVTFAVTAAIDAVIGKGDYISQLCNLELGNYLKYKGYLESGWNGAWAPEIYDQILRFGVVNKKEIQQSQGCAGIKEYPMRSANEGNIMTPDEFRYVSENVSEFSERVIHPHTHVDIYDRFETLFSDNGELSESVFENIKTGLAKGHRVTFGTLLVMSPDPTCGAGACVSYKNLNDTWALTDEIKENGLGIAGHEMVITGYDDNATVTDKDGKKHQGLLKLRNSWGSDVGDAGNYYMTYEYFLNLVLEAHEVVVYEEEENIAVQ